ncbi:MULTISPECIES: hypothetical protein [Curtobacterium]|uniref:hypothetical protein n=1 Tax=Curtobacterium TaxID=2034 RepID=UPI00217CEB5E|nr:hypothetical protein [Curtobacterium flaccumfaciens]MCS6563253.1 hypothetical protein [Curtobacterium flaccumfaciens pv. poinsettiae]UXN30149.1 hypothetical protein N8D75_07835 [Curtobacterium flaccumfaciens]
MAVGDEAIAARFIQESLRSTTVSIPDPDPGVESHAREAQNAIRAAFASSKDAIAAGSLLNRLSKVSQGKSTNGNWTEQAQDSLRAAILFAGAGLDRALKSLVTSATGPLLSKDQNVKDKFEFFAAESITDQQTHSVNPREFVRLFLNTGKAPQDVLQARWVHNLTSGSAQSAERVEELASALGVVESDLRKRIKPGINSRTALQSAFDARNQIAHELDVTKPLEELRRPLERIRARRAVADTEEKVGEMLSVAQLLVNDVAARLAAPSAT